LLQSLVGHGLVTDILEIGLHQRLVAQEGELVLEVLAVGQLLFLRGLRDELHIDEKADELLTRLLVDGGPGGEFIEGELDFALRQALAIDGGDDGRRIDGRGSLCENRPRRRQETGRQGNSKKAAEPAGKNRRHRDSYLVRRHPAADGGHWPK